MHKGTKEVAKLKPIQMATSNRKTTPDEAEEEMQLEATLQSLSEEKKAVFERTRDFDEQLRKIRQEEDRVKEILLQKRTDKVEKEQRERHSVPVEAQKKTTKQEAELQAQLKILKTENDRLKQQLSALIKSADAKRTSSEYASELEELELLKRKYCEQNRQLEKLRENLHRTTKYSKTQYKEKREKDGSIKKLTQRVGCMEDENQKLIHRVKTMEDEIQLREAELNVFRTQNEHQNKSLIDLKENLQHITSLSRAQQMTVKSQEDKISAAQQIAIETQLRQLNEPESLTEENEQLKQALTSLYRQQQSQQQQPTVEEHPPGNKDSYKCFTAHLQSCGCCK